MNDRSPLDVAKIVDEIREEIQNRRAAGDLTAEDIEWLLERRLKASIAKARIDESLAARLLHESHDWNTDTGYEIRTARPGFSGALIRAAKFAVRPFVRLYTDHILNRQSQINLAMWHILLDSVEHSAALEMEIRKLQKEVSDLKDRA
ncbi:MAG TPA: hypothetical protein PKU70_02160 [Vicinamibacteria bacterium]|nr:hypothetical protein [Vicinamibacteria bacterium]